jgi:HEAT repeat protein
LSKDTNKTTVDIVSDVLEKLEDENIVTQLAVLLESDSEDIALGAARALGLIGTSDAVAAMGEVVMTTMNNNLFNACWEAILSILRKGRAAAGSFFAIADLVKAAEPPGRVRLIKCLGASRSEEAVRFLLDFLGDEEVVVNIAAVNALGRLQVCSPRVCYRVRKYIHDRDIGLKKQAITALGQLKDWNSVPYLIDLLGSDNSSVARNAHWSLKNITDLRFPVSHQRWISWWNREGTVSQRVYAIRALSGITLGREDVVGEIFGLMRDEDAQIRKEACIALETMRSTEAVPYLIDSLDDLDEDVKIAAHKALRKITGENLPLEKVAWEKWGSAVSKKE